MFRPFMPSGVTIDKLLRARPPSSSSQPPTWRRLSGRPGDPKGTEYEASGAMGLHYWQMMRLIVLSPAIELMIPPLVTLFIGFFQDTTLVVIVGLLDFLDTVRSSMRDPPEMAAGIVVLEGYMFAAFSICSSARSWAPTAVFSNVISGWAMTDNLTVIRNAAWAVLWDEAEGQHAYAQDVDVAFSDAGVLQRGRRLYGPGQHRRSPVSR